MIESRTVSLVCTLMPLQTTVGPPYSTGRKGNSSRDDSYICGFASVFAAFQQGGRTPMATTKTTRHKPAGTGEDPSALGSNDTGPFNTSCEAEDDGEWNTDNPEEIDQPSSELYANEHFLDPPDVTISPGVSMVGDLSFPKLLRVEGSFKGSLQCGGDIIVAEGGVLESDVVNERGYLLVGGKLIGNINARRIQISETGQIFGNIMCNSLIIATGAIVIGDCQVRPQPPEKHLC